MPKRIQIAGKDHSLNVHGQHETVCQKTKKNWKPYTGSKNIVRT